MFKAILQKEFLKIKYIYLCLVVVFLCTLAYLYFNTIQNFSNIEPHSMLWYEAAHIGQLYYEDLRFLPFLAAIIIALAQFLPEIHKNKFRIPLHLPINQNKMVFLYLGVGFLLLLILNTILLLGLYFISSSSYAPLITLSAVKTAIPWVIVSFIVYCGSVAIMIEPYFKRKAFIASIFFTICSMLFFNMNYEAYSEVYIFIIFLFLGSLFIPLLSLYRFKNGDYSLEKEKSILPKITFVILSTFAFISLSFFIPHYFKEFSKDNSLATYVFYSAKQKKFIYKQHFGNHNFLYKDSLNNTFSKDEYEASLPFLFWRNLDIQKKLPIVIDDIEYDKKTIKKARQSFRLNYKNLAINKKQIELYPLFNPSSKKGVISFPDVMFTLKNSFKIYDSENNSVNEELSKKYTKILEEKGFSYPAQIIAGKTTNIKPLDEGYFVLDKKEKLFHIKMYDDVLYTNTIAYDKSIKIKDIKISESRKKEFYGVLLDQNNSLYIISYDKYKLIKLPLKHYHAPTMQVEIYADALNKLIRYQDEKNVFVSVFDTKFNYIDSFKADIPQVNPYFKEVFDYAFTFYIKTNPYKTYEEYSLQVSSYKAFIISFIFALFAFIFFKKQSMKLRIIKTFIILISGIYGLIFLLFV